MVGGHPHPQSPEVLSRLARAEGHLKAIRQMAEEGRPCAEILHQIGAVQAALRKIAQQVLEDHLDRCVLEAVPNELGKELIESLKVALSTYMR